MKITSFNPLILTKDAESAIALFEALGFERRHMKTGFSGDITSVSMKNSDGFHVDVTKVDTLPGDMVTIRVNVDNFEEAYELLTARGFKNIHEGDGVTNTGSSRATMMVSPSGFSISLVQHIKD
ncbi:MAG: hypothetical protein II881_07585 [Oscillospiraceae bacterium]|nr:hypothetical protein [Oscillospiraceae bacterium]